MVRFLIHSSATPSLSLMNDVHRTPLTLTLASPPLAYIFDVKGLWTNFAQLWPIIRRMVILLCVAMYEGWCGVVWCGVVWYGVVWRGIMWCGVVWCGGVCVWGGA